ncbi:MAG: DUF177 domain-containing protein [Bifidobacteriaceae bacterium]|jgi:uncharacterized protein|nr:DUF177 domain-containing protein [Bifidobacteriaceae bacterium]
MAHATPQYPNQSPWAIPVAQVGSRAGQSLEIDRDFPAPSGIGDEFYGVAEGSDVRVEARFDSIVDGLIFTATATARVTGECGRCLTPIDRDEEIQLNSFMPYESTAAMANGASSSTGRGGKAEREETIIAGEEETEDINPLSPGGDFANIETLLRDGFTQAIPVTPLCRPDCLGLCPQCGLNLNDHPDHVHETTDIRLSALEGLKEKLEAARDANDSHSK